MARRSRFVCLVAMALVLGFLANVAIAWWAAWRCQSLEYRLNNPPHSVPFSEVIGDTRWEGVEHRWAGFSATLETQVGREVRTTAGHPPFWSRPANQDWDVRVQYVAGWPWVCFHGQVVYAPSEKRSGVINLGSGASLPWHPIWTGAILNVVVLSACFLAAISLARFVFSASRRHGD